MANTPMLTTKGLYTFQNFLSAIPEGSLLDATNVVVDRDGIIEPRRGIRQYGEFGIASDVAKQLLTYKGRILAHYGSLIAHDDASATGTFTDFVNNYDETQLGLRIKGIEANSNFYVTTATGIKKIAANSVDLSIADESDAGGIKALDGVGTLVFAAGGFLPGLSQVAYRIVWGTNDVNGNLILGAPSGRIVVINASTIDANVSLTFDVPAGVTTDYFYQVYRTEVFTALTLALLPDAIPNDELKLIIENPYVSGTTITVPDAVPQLFQESGALLYTNAVSGEGILQANDRPPIAKDIAVFNNSAFYANTTTRHAMELTLLGTPNFTHGNITNITTDTITSTITSAGHGLANGDQVAIVGTGPTGVVDGVHTVSGVTATTFDIPVDGTGANTTTGTWFGSYIDVTHGVTTNRYFFVGRPEITRFTFASEATFLTPSSWFEISAANNTTRYAIWFDRTGVETAPSTPGRVQIRANILGAGTAAGVATVVRNAVLAATSDFIIVQSVADLTFTTDNGPATPDAAAGAVPPYAGFAAAILIMQQGFGEDNTNNYILLSQNAFSSIAIEDTARSIVRIINQNPAEVIYGFYLSGSSNIPGSIAFERRTTVNEAFTITANNSTSGSEFNPNLTTAATSINEIRPNRLYFSKYQQPEAVPLVNFLDVGAKDKAILRIVSLRDSLFIFKEDGIYRLTGDIAPNFSIVLFDNSIRLIAPDTAAVLNNQIYALTDGGIATVTETGVGIISRPIENIFSRVSTDNYPNFATSSFGIGYETERSYYVWTVTNTTDTYATQCFRYNTFTQCWTRWDKPQTCVVLNNNFNNKLHFGSPTDNIVEVERKSLTRIDYADREIDLQLGANSVINDTTLQISSVAQLVPGDALVQTQNVTMSQYNTLLLKLDLDPRIGVTPGTFDTDYFATLEMVDGDNLTTKLTSLVDKLNADPGTKATQSFAPADVITGSPGTITLTSNGLFNGQAVRFTTTGTLPAGLSLLTTYFVVGATTNTFQVSATSGGSAVNLLTIGTGTHSVQFYVFSGATTFSVIQTEYNRMITSMNADSVLKFANYQSSSGTADLELTIESINKNLNRVTGTSIPAYMVGPIIGFKGIQSKIIWAPDTGGDPSLLKHYREATMLFESSAFRSGVVGYNTDLSPSFELIPFGMDGNGVWGGFVWGEATWGGGGASVPFRTYIPRQKQRCRYIRSQLTHKDAFYKYAVLGISYAFEVTSDRAYRGRS